MTTDFKDLWIEAFGDSRSFVDNFFATGFSPERCRYIRTEQQLACALYWFDVTCAGEKLAYLYAVATAKNLQNKGYCRRLLHHTHQQLKRQGYTGALLVPGDERLLHFYRKLGYRVCSCVREFTCHADGAIPLRCIPKSEYAALRNKFLPANAVVQTGPTLDFLSTFCSFFTGDGWLLAGSIHQGVLQVQEFLGDSRFAPSITATLGAKIGHFRTPGTEKPFAMYYPLQDAPAPQYFGLALD